MDSVALSRPTDSKKPNGSPALMFPLLFNLMRINCH